MRLLFFIFLFTLLTSCQSVPPPNLPHSDGIFSSDPSQKSNLPLASDPEMYNQTVWSTYRPQCYFGLKNRRPDSPMFGTMWYRQGTTDMADKISLRHWAMHEDNVVFMWNQHDGRSFGSQKIIDGQLEMRTDWFNFNSSSWLARLSLARPEWSKSQALILYFALQDSHSTLDMPDSIAPNGRQIHLLNGESAAVGGKFSLEVRPVEGGSSWGISLFAHRADPFVDMANVGELIKSHLEMRSNGNYAFSKSRVGKPNFVALQINLEENSVVEILFKREQDYDAPEFENGFKEREREFNAKFDSAFPISKDYPAIYHQMGHAALSNLLGGIGIWHGNLWMRSDQFQPPYSVKAYGPNSLISAVPSRTGFPRGFLWDEAHHNLLIHKFDPSLSLQIVAAYLDMMNVDGWIPREIVLGSEAEARMPAEVLVQEDWVANPPTFFYLLGEFISDSERADQFMGELKRLYPRIKQLYFWLRKSQQGPMPGTFRWHARNSTTTSMLNPKVLDSGLDDYPRATHPTPGEYHVDLLAWMAMASSVLQKLAGFAGDMEFLPKIGLEVAHLNDIGAMDRNHWSERAQQYCDYGLHSEAVDMIQVREKDGERHLVRRVLIEPRYQFVENVNGYANLFPFLMRLLPPNSPRLPVLLRHMADPQQLWTPYGLRSIAPWSPYYGSWNDMYSPPYWKGPIWINMNYYAISALKHYASLKGPYQAECDRMYAELRTNLLTNMVDQYAKTGFIWEHYNDLDGHGGGNHPFTGWSALVLAILAEN